MRQTDWTVKECDVRPAGNKGECFYCKAKVGVQHNKGCVAHKRTVVVEVTIPLVVSVPEDWDTDLINFHYTESSFCSDNVLRKINEYADRVEEAEDCMCFKLDVKYVREATEEDEEYQMFKVMEE